MQILTGAKQVRTAELPHRRQHFTNPDVQRIDVPYYPTLSLEKILAEFRPPDAIYEYLPDDVDEFNVNRQFVLDVKLSRSLIFLLQVINTLGGEKLRNIVQLRVHERKIKILESSKNSIAILPKFKQAIAASHQVSGRSARQLMHSLFQSSTVAQCTFSSLTPRSERGDPRSRRRRS